MPVSWRSEACDQRPDPESGALIFRLTQSAHHSANIYAEQPYTSPDGKRIAIQRSVDADPRIAPFDLYVADLDSLRIQVLDRDCQSIFVATSAWSGLIYYLSSSRDLVRVNLSTLEKQILWTRWPFPPETTFQTVSPDHRFMAFTMMQPSYNTALLRVDLQDKSWKILLEHPAIFASHLMYNPVPYDDRPGSDIMGMMHRGMKLNHLWDKQPDLAATGTGPTNYIIDNEGGEPQILPIGEPHNLGTGHQAWVTGTMHVIHCSGWNTKTWEHDPRWPEGNVFTAAPGDTAPTVFKAPEHHFNHIGVSRCGRYFVSDSYRQPVPAPIELVIGNIATGKYRTLVRDCGATGGGPACSHPHAYFTADSRHIIYNADPTLIGNVYAARIPEGFLESLD